MTKRLTTSPKPATIWALQIPLPPLRKGVAPTVPGESDAAAEPAPFWLGPPQSSVRPQAEPEQPAQSQHHERMTRHFKAYFSARPPVFCAGTQTKLSWQGGAGRSTARLRRTSPMVHATARLTPGRHARPGARLLSGALPHGRVALGHGRQRFDMPFAARLLGVQASALDSGGTSPTLTVDVQQNGTTVLDDPIDVADDDVTAGVITTAALADEAEITIDLDIGGSSPTWDDITVMLTMIRES